MTGSPGERQPSHLLVIITHDRGGVCREIHPLPLTSSRPCPLQTGRVWPRQDVDLRSQAACSKKMEKIEAKFVRIVCQTSNPDPPIFGNRFGLGLNTPTTFREIEGPSRSAIRHESRRSIRAESRKISRSILRPAVE